MPALVAGIHAMTLLQLFRKALARSVFFDF